MTQENWFDVDRAGLAAILERRGKAWAVLELIQNAWDSGPLRVSVNIAPIGVGSGEGASGYSLLTVEDDSAEGWADLGHAFTMFSRSRRSGDAEKRGRFNLGEKMVLSLCRWARIATTNGTVEFDSDGRHVNPDEKRERGTVFTGEIRITAEELAEIKTVLQRLIPPVPTLLNGERIVAPEKVTSFTTKLPTEIADSEGNLRRSSRVGTVEVYATGSFAGGGEILEMGIPICEWAVPWRVNVLQKVPLNLERDGVNDAFRRALQVAVVNNLHSEIASEQASETWVQESLADGRIQAPAVKSVIVKQFGERAVVATPGDPVANATAERNGFTVVHGGSLSGGAWANVRKHEVMPAAGVVFPTTKPAELAARNKEVCPTCKRAM